MTDTNPAIRVEEDSADDDVSFRAQVLVGLIAADSGDVVSAEEVEVEALAWRKRMLVAMNRKERTGR
ncbi:hypothetical protein [Pinirhizobacter soli]|uniref:hypothetical protein n=1 Tax=Pinirhizobacter soli TaxID=2786953 RepID=UPI00202A4055|nr:hypothetical protein [Pinirhizobacter soli]